MLEDIIRSMLRDEVRSAVRDELRSAFEEALRTVKPTSGQEFLSVKEASRVAGVSAGTVRTWIQKGHLRRFGEGRVVRIRREELIQWLASGDGRSGAEDVSWEQQAAAILGRRRSL